MKSRCSTVTSTPDQVKFHETEVFGIENMVEPITLLKNRSPL